MTNRSGWLLTLLAAALLAFGSVGARAAGPEGSNPTGPLAIATAQPQANEAGTGIRPMTDAEQQSAGCVIASTAGLGISYAMAPNEMIMLVVGGLVIPSNSSILFLGLFGTVAAASCAVGSVLTPALTWAYERLGA